MTVADAIQMRRWADPGYFLGGEPDGPVGLFSPDGKQFIIVVKRGNLEHNTNEYSLLLFRTSAMVQSEKPQVVLTMSSSSNRDAITHMKWLDDSRTVVFLGENPGEIPKVYSFNIGTRKLKKLASQSTPIVAYDISSNGQEIVYEAGTRRTIAPEEIRRTSVVITAQDPSDLLICGCDAKQKSQETDRELFLQKNGQVPLRVPSVDFVTENLPLSLSPTGRYALLAAYVKDIPPSWSEYQDKLLHPYIVERRKSGTRSNVARYMVLDTESMELTPLLDTPMYWFNNGFAWAKDGNSVVLSGMYLPLRVSDPVEREARKKQTYVAEVKLPSRDTVKIADKDLKVVQWDQATGTVVLKSGYWWKDLSSEAYRRIGLTWQQVPLAQENIPTDSPLDVTLEEDSNTPPRIFVSDTKKHRRALLLDLNPQFGQLQFGKVESVSWKATDGHEVVGGLYLPPDYTSGNRYPLVIQTHGFRKDRFWIDGPWSSAFAAQPLAAKGIVVLQVGNASDLAEDLKYSNTPEEGQRQMAAYEGAVDYLDERGLIDRSHVGLIGFSRTVFYVEYTLTHSKYSFGAATVADGFDGGYMNYLLWPGPDFVHVNGGPPFGSTLTSWLTNSPGFNLDKVRTPVRIEYYGPAGFLEGWQWFSGLSLLEKPVDFVWLPDGTHLLVKPRERLTSQGGSVDWFSFWLKGEKESSSAKRGQYERWEELRSLQNREAMNPDVPSNH